MRAIEQDGGGNDQLTTGRLKFVLASDLSGIQIDESVVGADRFAVTGVITLGYLGSPASSHVGHSDGR